MYFYAESKNLFSKSERFLAGCWLFLKNYFSFKSLNKNDNRFIPSLKNIYPCLGESDIGYTPFEPHYTYHLAWAARVVKDINPTKHVDVASSLPFCTILSAFVPVEFYDLRPAQLYLDNLQSKRGDLLSLPFKTNSVSSISCMHTVEHIGMGRYGEPIDPKGDLKAIEELKRVVKKGGSLLFVVPIGAPRIIFNAHRIYSHKQILSYFDGFKLQEFSLIPDNAVQKGMIKNATEKQADLQDYGCGCYWFIKR